MLTLKDLRDADRIITLQETYVDMSLEQAYELYAICKGDIDLMQDLIERATDGCFTYEEVKEYIIMQFNLDRLDECIADITYAMHNGMQAKEVLKKYKLNFTSLAVMERIDYWMKRSCSELSPLYDEILESL